MSDCCSKIKCGVGSGDRFFEKKYSAVLLLERTELEEEGVCRDHLSSQIHSSVGSFTEHLLNYICSVKPA